MKFFRKPGKAGLAAKIPGEDKSGLYLTVTVHVAAVIVLLIFQLSTTLRGGTSYLFDFSGIDQKEQEARESEFRESISDRLDELIAAGGLPYAPDMAEGSDIRNIAVDAGNSGHLTDDRNTDAEQLYKDAERLEKELASGAFAAEPEDEGSFASMQDGDTGKETAVYTGPSVISYSLDGRKARYLPVPAYRCQGSGDVTVRITVEQSGKVVGAEIVDEFSSPDRCQREYAKKAAMMSIFTSSLAADRKQYGEIVYRFIAQ